MRSAKLAGVVVLLFVAIVCVPPGAPPPVAPPTVSIGTADPGAPLQPSSPGPVALVTAPAPPPALDAVRDVRFLRRALRPRPLLVTEIQGLETLFANTPASSLDRPAMMRRLAEEYEELALTAERDRRAASTGAERGHADKIVAAARASEVKYYQLLVREHPQWCAVPKPADPSGGTGCADEALYYLGLAGERSAQLDLARRTYLELIQKYPASSLVPGAYLAFGELFFERAQSDATKLPVAEQAYLEVVKYPPPDNRFFGLANFRLAQVFAKNNDDARALVHLARAALFVKTYGGDPALGTATRQEAIGVFARVGDPTKARAAFAPFASSEEDLDAMVGELERRRQNP